MASRSRKLEIVIAGDAKGALGAFGEVERGAGGLGDKLKTTGGKIAGFGAKASLAITLPMVALGKAAFGEAEEAQKIAKQTEAVVRSTGGAANVSVGQVGVLADKLSALSGVDDELIQTNANVLLTLTRIRNEVGKGNDVFDQASLAALNMSTALGTDLQGATVMVGKALNDPIAGITAMTRAGVQFTDAQKDQIASLVESGDMLGAQKIILGELETQFGGSAAAQATAADKAKVAWGNFMESIGAVLLPFIEKASTFLGDLAAKFGALSPKVQKMVVLGAGLAAALGPVVVVVGNVVKVVGALSTVVGAISLPVGIAIAAIAALVAGAIYAYKNFQGFRDAVDGAVSWLRDNVPGIFDTIKNAVVGAFNWIRDNVVPVVQTVAAYVVEKFGELVAWVKQMWPQISEAISHVMNVVAGIIRTVVDVVSALWRAWGDDLFNVARTAFEFIRSTIENVINVVKGIIQTVLAIINGDWGLAWNGIKGVLAGIWDQMLNIVSTVFNLISSAIGGVLSTIAEVWRGAWGGIRDFLSGVWTAIQNAVLSGIQFVVEKMGWMATKVLEAADFAFGWIGPLGDKLNDAKGKIKGFVDNTNAELERIKDQEVNVKVVRTVKEIIEKYSWGAGDGPGGPSAPRGGKALARVQSIIGAYPGLRITNTYRTPEHNRRVGGSPTSFHMDRNNPAVDIGGPTWQLDRFAGALRAAGGWRELLWRVRGHYDHVHAAHQGELIGPGSPGWREGLSRNERLRVVEVGETIVPSRGVGGGISGGGDVHIHYHIGTFVGSDERAFVELEKRVRRKGYVRAP